MAKFKGLFKKRRRSRTQSLTEIPVRRSPIPLNISSIKRQLQLRSNSFSIFSRQHKLRKKRSTVSVESLHSGDNVAAPDDEPDDEPLQNVVSCRVIGSTVSCRSGFGSHFPDSIKLGIVILLFVVTAIQSIAVLWVITEN